MSLPEGSEAALPQGMVSAEQVVEILRDADYDGYALGVESSVDYVESRDAQWRKALDEARDALGDLAVHDADLSLALAASQAETRALREALDYVQDHGYACNEHGEEHICDSISSLLSRPPGDMDALREVCEKVAAEAWNTGWNHALGMGPGDPTGPNGFTEAIVARVLGGSHA